MFNIDEMLDEVENTSNETEAVKADPTNKPEADLTIVVKNAVTGQKTTMPVYLNNQLAQIVAGCKKDKNTAIGLNPNSSSYIYVNERTRNSTTDGFQTVEEFVLKENDVLAISDDGKVAGK